MQSGFLDFTRGPVKLRDILARLQQVGPLDLPPRHPLNLPPRPHPRLHPHLYRYAADLDSSTPPDLELANYGFTEADLEKEFHLGNPMRS